MTQPHRIETVEQLSAVLGEPNEMVAKKVSDHIDPIAAEFIANSPLLVMSTSGKDGTLDVSPKGDAPGFVVVKDANTLLVPDRPGNKLAFGFRNIIETGQVSLIFFVPGQRETLRVNGRAAIYNDPEELASLQAQGKPALLCTRIQVEACFFHCGKALIRSKLWQAEQWNADLKPFMVRQAKVLFEADDALEALIEKEIEKNYRDELY